MSTEVAMNEIGLHQPVITRGDGGVWRVFCDACSQQEDDYVPVCRDKRIAVTWPPVVLVEYGSAAAKMSVRKRAPLTSKVGIDKIRAGTVQGQILALFIGAHNTHQAGATDDDLEFALSRSHQSVSAARNHLCAKGYVIDTGRTRPNRHRNDAIVWAYSGKPVVT